MKYRFNGEGFTYDRRPQIFVVAADGGAPPRQLTEGDHDHADPAWSPDGRSIAFTSARHDERDHDDVTDIWLVAAPGSGSEGGAPRRLTATAGPAGHAAFSPAGDTIAYLGRAESQRVRRQHPALRDPGRGRRAPLSHRRLRSLLLAARRAAGLEPRRQRHHRGRGGPGQPRRLPGAGRGRPGHADRRGRARDRRLLRVPRRPDHGLRGERARLPGRDLRLRRGRRRREAASPISTGTGSARSR